MNRNHDMNELKKEYMNKEMSTQQIEAMKSAMERAKKEQESRQKVIVYRRCAATAAGLALALIILPNTSKTVAYAMSQIPVLGKLVEVVTVRDYEYEDDRNLADVKVPELVVASSQEEEALEKSVEEINAEIQAITGPFIEEFEKNLKNEQGYQEIGIKSEVINTTQDYFTLKLICYAAEGSSAEWYYYYTIDLNTGERLQLSDFFAADADYVTPISENIISQMRKKMEEDEMNMYWLDDEIEELNFKAIKDEQSFYLDEEDRVVISFEEGEVAPMYMGVVEFTIPNEVISDIRIN